MRMLRLWEIDITKDYPKDIPEYDDHDRAYNESNSPPTEKLERAWVPQRHKETTTE